MLKILRKPTIGVFWVGVVLALLYGMARHDVWHRCPDLRGHMPVFSNPAGIDPGSLGLSVVMCTDQDPAYVDMQHYGLGVEICFVVLVVLAITDATSFSLGGSRRLRRRQHRKDSRRKANKFLVYLSKFFGGL
jgi:hypothetical protein